MAENEKRDSEWYFILPHSGQRIASAVVVVISNAQTSSKSSACLVLHF
jgi:hypothetical protein